jgi:hypothetical protein
MHSRHQKERHLHIHMHPFSNLLLKHLYRAFSSWANTNVLYLGTQKIFDEFTVLLGGLGQLVPRLALGNVGFPAGQGNVFDLYFSKTVEIGYPKSASFPEPRDLNS